MILNVFHGTVIEITDNIDDIESNVIFDNLSTSYSDLDTLFFSQNENVGETFARYRLASVHNGVEVLLEGELELDDDKIFNEHIINGIIDFKGVEYDFPNDREELYDALSSEGYQAMIVDNNYHTSGNNADDIAIFDESLYTTKSAKIKVDGKWSLDIKSEEQMCSVLEKISVNEEEKLPSVDI